MTTSAISQTSEARSPQPKGDPAAAPSSAPHDRPPDFFPGEEPQGFIESRTSLLSARGHSMLLNYDRARFISTRLSAVALFLAIATIAWVPVDVVLLDQHWTIIAPLMAGRLVTGLLFLAVASLQFRTAGLREELFLLGLVICIGVGFLLYSHYTLAVTAGGAFNTDRAHTAYSLFPVALAAGLAIFPLTVEEIASLLLVPMLALLGDALLGDALLDSPQSLFARHGSVMLLLGAIVVITVVCSLSQLQLLIRLHDQSTVDPLTNLLSRRAGSELLNVLFARSARTGGHFSLLLLDLDNFKSVNDAYGHNAGDFLLCQVARCLKQALRGEDLVIRWGGEEFLIVLSRTTSANAAKVVGSLCRTGLGGRPDGALQTASVGLAERIEDRAKTWHDLVDIADERMYRAKVGGRNCLVSTDGMPHPLTTDFAAAARPARRTRGRRSSKRTAMDRPPRDAAA